MATTIYPTTDALLWTHLLGTSNTYLQVTADGYTDLHSVQVTSGSGGTAIDNVYADIWVKYNDDGQMGTPYQVFADRYLVEFDTSNVDRAPKSAAFYWYSADASQTGALICVEGNFETNGMINKVEDWSSHNTDNPIAYTEAVSAGFSAGYIAFNLTEAGRIAMANRDEFQMVCMDATYDYTRTQPAFDINTRSNMIQDEEPSGAYSSLQPKLAYTMKAPYKITGGKVHIKGGKLNLKSH